MMTIRTSHKIALLAAAAMLASGIGLQTVNAQDSSKSSQRTEKSDKKKSTEKKSKTQTTQSGGGAAPMSGFQPDPVSNY